MFTKLQNSESETQRHEMGFQRLPALYIYHNYQELYVIHGLYVLIQAKSIIFGLGAVKQ